MTNEQSAHITAVSSAVFYAALDIARSGRDSRSEIIRSATGAPADVTAYPATYWLTLDRQSGFAVRDSGELVGVFSGVKGRGDALVKAALEIGATHLDCFDAGPLVALYERHGFVIVRREANWFEGGPDVVYMELRSTWLPGTR